MFNPFCYSLIVQRGHVKRKARKMFNAAEMNRISNNKGFDDCTCDMMEDAISSILWAAKQGRKHTYFEAWDVTPINVSDFVQALRNEGYDVKRDGVFIHVRW